MDRKRIATIIVTKDRPTELKDTICSLLKQRDIGEKFTIEIYIVDNSNENFHRKNLYSLRNLKEEINIMPFPMIKIIRPSENIGAGPGYFLALKHINLADFILKSDDDVVYGSDYISTLLKFFTEDETLGALSGLVFYFSYPDRVWYLGGQFIKPLVYTKRISDKEVGVSLKYVEDLVSCAMLIRYEALRESGGFDKDFFVYKDDTSLCYRLRMKGYKLGITGSTKVLHRVPYPSRLTKFSVYYDTFNRFIFSRKFHSFPEKILFTFYMVSLFPTYKLAKFIKMKGLKEGLNLFVTLCNAIKDGLSELIQGGNLNKIYYDSKDYKIIRLS